MFALLKPFCLMVAMLSYAQAGRSAVAQDLLTEEWQIDPRLSNVYMQTVKANSIFETHQFTSIEGTVSKDGLTTIKIELASLDTGKDLRDVRMRFLLFETFKFPYAVITAKLDKEKLKLLSKNIRITYPLKFKVDMHGIVQEREALVWVTRISDTTVSVASIQPIAVTAESFEFTKNLARLTEIIGGTQIASGASITFDLVFGTGSHKSEIEVEQSVREQLRARKAAKTISTEDCETRFDVISQTNAIYFGTGSDELDAKSVPLLDSVADIAKHCPSIKIEVTGHTDSVGGDDFNQRLSERRAKAVVDYLTNMGFAIDRIHSVGYGATRPVAPNDSEESRAKNRRIEFKVHKT